MKSLLRKLLKMNLRSIFLNFYLLSFRQAVRLPLLVSRNTKILELHRGGVRLNSGFIKPAMVQIGYNAVGNIDPKYERSIIEISKNAKVVFNGRCFLGNGTRLNVHGKLSFDADVRLNGNTNVCCVKEISFGANSIVSWDCLFMDTDFHKVCFGGKIVNEPRPVSVGKNCWIGCRATILKSSNIPDGSVVGAGSLVCGKLTKKNAVYAGNPAKMIKENVRWEE